MVASNASVHVGSHVIIKQLIKIALVASQNRCVGYRLDNFIHLEATVAPPQFSVEAMAAARGGKGGSGRRRWQLGSILQHQ
jgi:hypothetical protein